MKMVFNVAPRAVQGFRDSIVKDGAGNPRIVRYQTKETREFQRAIATAAQAALGSGFMPWTGPIQTRTAFVFAVPQCRRQEYIDSQRIGRPLWVTSRPDLSDNLHKGFLDALKGILFRDDALIVWSESRKVYGWPARIEFEAFRMDVDNEQQELF